MRHPAFVRITHWITAASFGALVVSGVAILLAHPRLYWGETGALGAPSLIDLPLPMILTGQTGWGRSLHFLSAWIAVLTGALYVAAGVITGHFGARLLPTKTDRSWSSVRQALLDHRRPWRLTNDSPSYNVIQRLAYLAVIFVLFPLMIWTGLAMSPAITSVIPALVSVLGGHQSARTIHFIVANLLLVFVLVHLAMIVLTGFWRRMRAMITGHVPVEWEGI